MRLNIQAKLFLLLAGLTSAVLFGVLIAVNNALIKNIEEKVLADFRATQASFSRTQRLLYDRLVESASLLVENSTFKGNIEIGNKPEIYQQPDKYEAYHRSVFFTVTEFADVVKADLILSTDRYGKLLAEYGNPVKYGDDLSKRPDIEKALRGQVDFEPKYPQLWAKDGDLYEVATVPVYTLGDIVLGTLTLGTKFTKAEALELKGGTAIDITLFLGDTLVATTMDSLKALNLKSFFASQQGRIERVLKDTSASEPFVASVAGEESFLFLAPLGVGEKAYYLASVSRASELRVLGIIQQSLFIAAAVSLLVTVALAISLGRLFSKPIRTLAGAMTKVKGGELSVQVTPSSQDEVGDLAQNFNEMVVGLRERMQLQKYVGSYTLEMVKKTSGNSVDPGLGGVRQNLAVLFSDVRGFTAFSERHEPEEVVSMLNKYLSFQAELVMENGGSVDKFVGDEMVAVFAGEDALWRALECARQIQRRVREEHEGEEDGEKKNVHIGIGVNYGAMVLGNIGAENRRDYTVIGSEVNLGARLCSAAKAGQILVRQELLANAHAGNLGRRMKIGTVLPMTFKGVTNQLDIAEILYD